MNQSAAEFGLGSPGGDYEDAFHQPTRPVDKEKAESELTVHLKKATSPEETAPKQKHVRSAFTLMLKHGRSSY
jgi:hypothetical protein